MKTLKKRKTLNNRIELFKAAITGFIILFSGSGYVMGQQSNVLYYMNGVPQSYLVNPATQPSCDVYVGIPVISPVQVFVENSSFSISDVMWYEGDTTRLFFNTTESQSDFLSNLGNSNYISADVSTSIFSFGFRTGDIYVTYDLTERASFRFAYPGDLIKFMFEGNEDGEEFNLSSIGIEAVGFLEFAAGVSHKINDQVVLGYRGKFLLGQGNISTRHMNAQLLTGREEWIFRSGFDLNATLPFIDIPTDSAGDFSFDDINTQDNLMASDYVRMITGNKGLAVDAGINYTPMDKLTLSASLLDLGFIRWKHNTYNISQDVEYIFEGIETDISKIDTNFFHDLGDSLLNIFDSTFVLNNTNSEKPYTSFLGAKLYLGGRYQIIPEISVGLLSRTEIFKGRIREQLTLSANFYPIKLVSASLSYTIMNKTFNNFGFGLSLKPGPFNIYIITDNIPFNFAVEQSSGIPIPHKNRSLNVRFGFNLVFGCDKEKRKTKDQPLIRTFL
jgi:hypothetical protein